MFSNYLVCVHSLQKYSPVKGKCMNSVTQSSFMPLPQESSGRSENLQQTQQLLKHHCPTTAAGYEDYSTKKEGKGMKNKGGNYHHPLVIQNPHLSEWPMQPTSSYWKIRIPYDSTLTPTRLRAAFVLFALSVRCSVTQKNWKTWGKWQPEVTKLLAARQYLLSGLS